MQLEVPVNVDYARAGIPVPEEKATMTCYLLPPIDRLDNQDKKPMVIVVAGGGYHFRSGRETEPYAMHFLAAGMHAAVLHYHVAPSRYPTAALELAWCVQECRRRAGEWNIDPDSIHIIGSSAGGHLCATLGTTWHWPVFAQALEHDVSWRPDSQLLCYPVLTSGEYAHRDSFVKLLGEDASPEAVVRMSMENNVTEKTVPTFLWHTVGDQLVPVENSLLYAAALQKHRVPFELHLYEKGGHGLATCDEITAFPHGHTAPDVAGWMDLAIRFVRRRTAETQ